MQLSKEAKQTLRLLRLQTNQQTKHINAFNKCVIKLHRLLELIAEDNEKAEALKELVKEYEVQNECDS